MVNDDDGEEWRVYGFMVNDGRRMAGTDHYEWCSVTTCQYHVGEFMVHG